MKQLHTLGNKAAINIGGNFTLPWLTSTLLGSLGIVILPPKFGYPDQEFLLLEAIEFIELIARISHC